MPPTLEPCGPLAGAAHASLRQSFAGFGHALSPPQWGAVADLLNHLQRAADGHLDAALYVSAIPAGTGKSTSLAAFAAALCDSPDYAGTGMVVFCNRVDECRDMAAALQTHRGRLCVIVGRDRAEVLALGDHTAADGAQIVIATQAALRATLRTARDFGEAGRFHYRGKRRAVVCWDEAIAFSRPVTLDNAGIGALIGAVQRQAPQAVGPMHRWAADIADSPAGRCAVPEFRDYGVDFDALEEAVADDDRQAAAAKALGLLSGGAAWIARDNRTGGAIVASVPDIPNTILPAIVTDASAARGVNHGSYARMARNRRIVWLAEAGKTYRNLCLRIVDTGASRSAFRDGTERGAALLDVAARYIQSVPQDRQILVVGYKGRIVSKGVREKTIRAALEARLSPEDQARVSWLSWGGHTATNQHKDTRHVLLLGLNYLPYPTTYAAAGASLDLPMTAQAPEDHPTAQDIEEAKGGLLRDAALQAILRGNARRGQDGDCGEMEAVVLQSRRAGLSDDDYRAMFPGVVVVHDRTLLPFKPLRGRMKDAADVVLAMLRNGMAEIAYPAVYRDLGMPKSNFGRLTKRPQWAEWLDTMGLRQTRLRGGVVGVRAV